MARWHRESLITPIWEGPSNIQALDLLEAMQKKGAHRPFLAWLEARLKGRSEEAEGALAAARKTLDRLAALGSRGRPVLGQDGPEAPGGRCGGGGPPRGERHRRAPLPGARRALRPPLPPRGGLPARGPGRAGVVPARGRGVRPLPFALAWGLGLGGVLFLPPIPEGWECPARGPGRPPLGSGAAPALRALVAWGYGRLGLGEASHPDRGEGCPRGARGQAGWGTLGGKEGG